MELGIAFSIFIMIFTLVIGMAMGYSWAENWWKAQLVGRGFAQYNAKTGKWEWKEPTTAG